MSSHVKIGPEFFAKIKLDYADWRWALAREFLQNCFDAPGCSEVVVTVESACNGRSTALVVSNDGEPMTEDVLVNKLLTLGGSGKNFEGENTGGFGVAKSLLYYTHSCYEIMTGTMRVSGSGAEYTLEHDDESYPGTKSFVLLDGDEVSALVECFRRFAHFSQWKGRLTVNGEAMETDLKKGARRRDLGWATIYTNKTFSNACIVRLNGQPMFTRYTRFKGCVLVELNGKAKDTLTSNRDNLTGKYDSELGDLLTALAVDKRSALREQKAEYKRWLGEKQRNEAKKPKKAAELDDLIDVAALLDAVIAGPETEERPTATGGTGNGSTLVVESREDVAKVSLGHEFIIKNTTGMVIPEHLLPGGKFSRYCKDLVRSWVAVLVKLHQIFDVTAEFSVGFVIDEESQAEHETGVYGQVYYLNPVRIVCQREKPQCRSMKSAYAGAWSNRYDLISTAAHEFVHGAFGLREHDENYAGKLTEVMAKVVEHGRELSAICRS